MRNLPIETGDVRPDVKYSNEYHSQQVFAYVKTILFYVFVFAFWLFVARMYRNFGELWLIPSVSVMWIAGAITAWRVPDDREATISQTKWGILGFISFLLLYRGVIQIISPISSEQMSASLNITIPAASGLAAAGLLQNILMIVSVLTPLGFVIWCAQKFRTYHGRQTRAEAFQRIKGIRENKRRF